MMIVRSQSDDYHFGLKLIVGQEWPDGHRAIAKPLVLESIADGPVAEPTMSGPMAREFLQAALDEAWRIGMRPSQSDSNVEASLRHHLQDMRALVFHEMAPDALVVKPRA